MALTDLFIIVTTAVVIVIVAAYDIWTYNVNGWQTTISWTLYTLAQRWPIVAAAIGFAVGALFGHFWWPQATN